MLKTIQFLLFSTLIIIGVSCGKEDTRPTEVTIPDDVLFYFTGKVDSRDIELLVTPTNDITTFITGGGSIGETCTYDYGGFIVNQFETPPGFGFDLLGFYEGICWDEPGVFPALFSKGTVPFATSDLNNSKEVMIQWQDENGFFTSLGGSQDGSTFTITNTEEGLLGERYLNIEGTVNCTLYKEGNPEESIELVDGQFKLTVEAQYN